MAIIRPKGYQVLITPLVAKDTYGTIQDITKDIDIEDFVRDGGISAINKEVDNGDFDFGVFVFDSLNLKCINFNGKFADPNDSRSIFKYSRDKAKVTINYFNGISNTPDASFKGLIDDRATKLNFKSSAIRFKLLSNDSIINRVKVPAGVVQNGSLISTSIKIILQLPEILAVLNYDEANINVLNDYVIDVGSELENISIKKALDLMLAASNSVMTVDKDTDDIFIRSREFNSGTVKDFFGDGDLLGRENIIDIKNHNTGLQRAFNTIRVGNAVESNLGLIEINGDNGKEFELPFITNILTEIQIAKDLLAYWSVPKIELELVATTNETKGLKFFDLVSVDYPYRVVPFKDSKLPIYGTSKYGTAVYPHIYGNLKIRPSVAFKVVGMREIPSTFLTSVKLRQVGTTIDDGFFGKIGTFYGTAIYGVNKYELNPSRIDPNTRSVYGAAKYGTVIYGKV